MMLRSEKRNAGPALACLISTALITMVGASAASATSYQWLQVCDNGGEEAGLYGEGGNNPATTPPDAVGFCSAAVSPQQQIDGDSSLQYFVQCSDAAAGTGTWGGPASDYSLSMAHIVYPDGGVAAVGAMVAWTATSKGTMGELVDASATSGSTPVKVSNSDPPTEHSHVTFAAGCANQAGEQAYNGIMPPVPDSSSASGASARAAAGRKLAANVRKALADFASGKRKRAEYSGVSPSANGLSTVFARVNLRSRRSRSVTLTCPAGSVMAGSPEVSYGYDKVGSLGSYRAPIGASRKSTATSTTHTIRPGRLRYPTVAYESATCATSSPVAAVAPSDQVMSGEAK